MGGNKLLNLTWEVIFFCKFQTFRHMTDDDTCTLKVVQLVVWVDACLILGKECRVEHLTNIMIKRTRTYQLALCTDSTGYFCGKITNCDRVLEGTRSNLTESA